MDRCSSTGTATGEAVVSRPATRLTALTLQLIQAWTNARSAAVFVRDVLNGPRLLVSDGIDQAAVDDITRLWVSLPPELEHGAGFHGHWGRPFLALPCRGANGISAIAYLEMAPGVTFGHDAASLLVLTEALRLSLVSENWPVDEGEWAGGQQGRLGEAHDNANLLFLLERHGWNISRVARVLRVTRSTVYSRMQRAHIRRPYHRTTRRGRACAT